MDNDKVLKIINYYGLKHQLKKLSEEHHELLEAIYEYFGSDNGDKEHIKEEIADVMVVLDQIVNYFNIKTDDIKSVMTDKINRTLKRIEDERRKD